MVETGIIRRPSIEEEKEYIQLGSKTPKEMFLKQLAEMEARFTKNHEPFDSQCCRVDFNDELESIERESSRKFGFVRDNDVRGLKFENLEKYGDKGRFEVVRDDEEVEMQNINNVRTAVKIGHTIHYKCKARGHGISVFYPQDVYEDRYEKKK